MNLKLTQRLLVAAAVLTCVIFATVLWLIPLWVFAADTMQTVTTSWSYTEEDQASITGFRIYDKDKTIVVNDIAPELRTVDFERDATKQNAYFMTAFRVYVDANDVTTEIESGPSNVVVVCDTLPIPINPEGFTLH